MDRSRRQLSFFFDDVVGVTKYVGSSDSTKLLEYRVDFYLCKASRYVLYHYSFQVVYLVVFDKSSARHESLAEDSSLTDVVAVLFEY